MTPSKKKKKYLYLEHKNNNELCWMNFGHANQLVENIILSSSSASTWYNFTRPLKQTSQPRQSM